ncbi:MAG TPA: HAD-IA family hydrolase [bacterium]|nr:HAD-IA family hydrolase [bacterium]HMW32214.1 HAD-IA family hydrolase [bacterium]HMW36727.1 HAD-IA family hydrolase [bacterium]HMY34691.1 HAD-IA family hydrolase [bacterium]HMZ03766.1 HAD-IA family hydrolase [bacterium]
MIKNIHQILFDFDYTLADSSEGIITCVNFALEKVGAPPGQPDAIRRMIGHSLENTFARFIDPSDTEKIQTCKSLFMEHADTGAMVRNTVMLDGVRETLEFLYNELYTLGIVSTKRRSTIWETLIEKEMDDFFDIVIGYEDVTHLKPHPEGLIKAIEELAGTPETTIYIGDSPLDIKAAKSANVFVVAVTSGMHSTDELATLNPDLIIPRLSDLKAHLAA